MKYFFPKFIILSFITLCYGAFAQEFNSSPLISLPGQNRNFEVIKKPYISNFDGNAGICFENYNENTYSICFRQIQPDTSKILFVASDSIPKSNPAISWLDKDSIRIVWQQLVDEKWQIFSRIIINDSLTQTRQLTRTVENNTNPQISGNNLIWINDLYLTYAQISDSLINIKKIDGSDCSNPDMHPQWLEVLYEQQVDSINNIIKKAKFIKSENRWALTKLINRGSNKNPRYDSCEEPLFFTYQKYDTVWESYVTDLYDINNIWQSNNRNFNISNPFFLYYPIPTKKYIRDWFVVYESDSLADNKEIFLEFTENYGLYKDYKINLSAMAGDDINPFSIILKDSVAVIWEHVENNASQIYWTKAPFLPYSDIDENSYTAPLDFVLKQNYPNPFNPFTSIEYFLPYSVEITLTVYNLLGEKIKTLVSSAQQRGYNKVNWDGNNENGQAAASGIYFYVLNYGKNSISKKMLLLR